MPFDLAPYPDDLLTIISVEPARWSVEPGPVHTLRDAAFVVLESVRLCTASTGRMADSQGNKSAFEDTDWHELQKERFASDIADLLYERAHKGLFDHIVLVASPNILGELRKELHQEVTNKVIAEIPKTLTGMPLDEIETRVTEDVRDAA